MTDTCSPVSCVLKTERQTQHNMFDHFQQSVESSKNGTDHHNSQSVASKIQLQQLSTETDDFCPQEFYDDLAELMTDGIGDGDTSVQSRHTQQHEMKFENLCCANYVPLSTHLSANSFTKHGGELLSEDAVHRRHVSSNKPTMITANFLGSLLLEALKGFIFVVNACDKIEFVSHNITQYFTNCSQDDLIGHSVYSIIHVADHGLFAKLLAPLSSVGHQWRSGHTKKMSNFACRMLIRNICDVDVDGDMRKLRPHESSQYQSMHITAVRQMYYTSPAAANDTHSDTDYAMCLVCMARRIPMTERTNTLLGVDQFCTKQNLNGDIESFDVRSIVRLGHLGKEILLRGNICDLCHSNDTGLVKKHYEDAALNGTNTSWIYRFRLLEGHYYFVQTKSKLFNNPHYPNDRSQYYTLSSHSIIRECDHDQELKVAASTTLMNSLILPEHSTDDTAFMQTVVSSLTSSSASGRFFVKRKHSSVPDNFLDASMASQCNVLSAPASYLAGSSLMTDPTVHGLHECPVLVDTDVDCLPSCCSVVAPCMAADSNVTIVSRFISDADVGKCLPGMNRKQGVKMSQRQLETTQNFASFTGISPVSPQTAVMSSHPLDVFDMSMYDSGITEVLPSNSTAVNMDSRSIMDTNGYSVYNVSCAMDLNNSQVGPLTHSVIMCEKKCSPRYAPCSPCASDDCSFADVGQTHSSANRLHPVSLAPAVHRFPAVSRMSSVIQEQKYLVASEAPCMTTGKTETSAVNSETLFWQYSLSSALKDDFSGSHSNIDSCTRSVVSSASLHSSHAASRVSSTSRSVSGVQDVLCSITGSIGVGFIFSTAPFHTAPNCAPLQLVPSPGTAVTSNSWSQSQSLQGSGKLCQLLTSHYLTPIVHGSSHYTIPQPVTLTNSGTCQSCDCGIAMSGWNSFSADNHHLPATGLDKDSQWNQQNVKSAEDLHYGKIESLEGKCNNLILKKLLRQEQSMGTVFSVMDAKISSSPKMSVGLHDASLHDYVTEKNEAEPKKMPNVLLKQLLNDDHMQAGDSLQLKMQMEVNGSYNMHSHFSRTAPSDIKKSSEDGSYGECHQRIQQEEAESQTLSVITAAPAESTSEEVAETWSCDLSDQQQLQPTVTTPVTTTATSTTVSPLAPLPATIPIATSIFHTPHHQSYPADRIPHSLFYMPKFCAHNFLHDLYKLDSQALPMPTNAENAAGDCSSPTLSQYSGFGLPVSSGELCLFGLTASQSELTGVENSMLDKKTSPSNSLQHPSTISHVLGVKSIGLSSFHLQDGSHGRKRKALPNLDSTDIDVALTSSAKLCSRAGSGSGPSSGRSQLSQRNALLASLLSQRAEKENSIKTQHTVNPQGLPQQRIPKTHTDRTPLSVKSRVEEASSTTEVVEVALHARESSTVTSCNNVGASLVFSKADRCVNDQRVLLGRCLTAGNDSIVLSNPDSFEMSGKCCSITHDDGMVFCNQFPPLLQMTFQKFGGNEAAKEDDLLLEKILSQAADIDRQSVNCAPLHSVQPTTSSCVYFAGQPGFVHPCDVGSTGISKGGELEEPHVWHELEQYLMTDGLRDVVLNVSATAPSSLMTSSQLWRGENLKLWNGPDFNNEQQSILDIERDLMNFSSGSHEASGAIGLESLCQASHYATGINSAPSYTFLADKSVSSDAFQQQQTVKGGHRSVGRTLPHLATLANPFTIQSFSISQQILSSQESLTMPSQGLKRSMFSLPGIHLQNPYTQSATVHNQPCSRYSPGSYVSISPCSPMRATLLNQQQLRAMDKQQQNQAMDKQQQNRVMDKQQQQNRAMDKQQQILTMEKQQQYWAIEKQQQNRAMEKQQQNRAMEKQQQNRAMEKQQQNRAMQKQQQALERQRMMQQRLENGPFSLQISPTSMCESCLPGHFPDNLRELMDTGHAPNITISLCNAQLAGAHQPHRSLSDNANLPMADGGAKCGVFQRLVSDDLKLIPQSTVPTLSQLQGFMQMTGTFSITDRQSSQQSSSLYSPQRQPLIGNLSSAIVSMQGPVLSGKHPNVKFPPMSCCPSDPRLRSTTAHQVEMHHQATIPHYSRKSFSPLVQNEHNTQQLVNFSPCSQIQEISSPTGDLPALPQSSPQLHLTYFSPNLSRASSKSVVVFSSDSLPSSNSVKLSVTPMPLSKSEISPRVGNAFLASGAQCQIGQPLFLQQRNVLRQLSATEQVSPVLQQSPCEVASDDLVLSTQIIMTTSSYMQQQQQQIPPFHGHNQSPLFISRGALLSRECGPVITNHPCSAGRTIHSIQQAVVASCQSVNTGRSSSLSDFDFTFLHDPPLLQDKECVRDPCYMRQELMVKCDGQPENPPGVQQLLQSLLHQHEGRCLQTDGKQQLLQQQIVDDSKSSCFDSSSIGELPLDILETITGMSQDHGVPLAGDVPEDEVLAMSRKEARQRFDQFRVLSTAGSMSISPPELAPHDEPEIRAASLFRNQLLIPQQVMNMERFCCIDQSSTAGQLSSVQFVQKDSQRSRPPWTHHVSVKKYGWGRDRHVAYEHILQTEISFNRRLNSNGCLAYPAPANVKQSTAFYNSSFQTAQGELTRDEDKRLVGRFAREYLRHDGVFALRVVAHNSSTIIIQDLVLYLWRIYRGKEHLHNSQAHDSHGDGHRAEVVV